MNVKHYVLAKKNDNSPEMWLPQWTDGHGWRWIVFETAEAANAVASSWNRRTGSSYVVVCIFPDGNQWCATLTNFINLQESPAGFGLSMADAVKNLGDEIAKETK